jgi:phytanoyl-CoA hydroxylase
MDRALTTQQIKQYEESGFCIVDGLIEQDLIAQARRVVDTLLSSDDVSKIAEAEPEDPTQARRIWSPTARDGVFAQIAESPRLLDAVAQLIGDNVMYQYSKLNIKPPRVGSVVSWHQDFAYYPHTNTDLVAVLIYLDDATLDNACLKVAAGSHHRGLLSHEVEGFFAGKISSLESVGVDATSVVDCEAPAGTAIFLHSLVAHASEKNTSALPRRAFIPAYRSSDAFPIYYGPHASHNEQGAKILRGTRSRYARCDGGQWRLPIAAAEFNSLYEIQEGAHLKNAGKKSSTGYFSHESSEV